MRTALRSAATEYEHIIDTVAADLFTMWDKTPHGAPLFLMCNEDGAAARWRGRKPNPNPNVPKPWPYIPYNLTHFSMDWYHDPTRSCRTDSDCDVPGVGTIGWCIAGITSSDSDYASVPAAAAAGDSSGGMGRCSNVRDLY